MKMVKGKKYCKGEKSSTMFTAAVMPCLTLFTYALIKDRIISPFVLLYHFPTNNDLRDPQGGLCI
jgi:hypothetical protein